MLKPTKSEILYCVSSLLEFCLIEFIFGKDFNLGLKGIPHFSILAISPSFDLDPHISPLALEGEALPSLSLFPFS